MAATADGSGRRKGERDNVGRDENRHDRSARDARGTGGSTRAAPPSTMEAKAAAARARILDAVIECLDRHGYAETSIARIQERAGMSRGALTHHFPSKEALMVETAERLLEPVTTPRRRPDADAADPERRGDAVEADIVWMWEKMVDTREGRALLEILVASRTDTALKNRIAGHFLDWNSRINRSLAASYSAFPAGTETQEEIWTLCRVFLRGLNTQSPFEPDRETRHRLVRRFARMIAHCLMDGSDGTCSSGN